MREVAGSNFKENRPEQIRDGEFQSELDHSSDANCGHRRDSITGVPAINGRPMNTVELNSAFDGDKNEDDHMAWATAVGLALQGADRSS